MASATTLRLLCHPRPLRLFQAPAWRSQARCVSYLSTHATFPATLVKFQTARQSCLSPVPETAKYPEHDSVRVSSDGYVHPGLASDNAFNGAAFMPNTHFMQQQMRMCIDHFYEESDTDDSVPQPVAISIPVGTPVPSSLILQREDMSQFSLQPSGPMRVEELNKSLDDFYSLHGRTSELVEWLEAHDYEVAASDDDASTWMGQ